MELAPTPELDKVREVAPFSQKIGEEFLDWCRAEKSWVLAEDARDDEIDDDDADGLRRVGGLSLAKVINAHPHGDLDMHPARYAITTLLAEFFEIDLNRVEEERRAILAALATAT